MELAGIVGVWPGPFTLRELATMSIAKQRADWNRTSSLMALQCNLNRAKESDPIAYPNQFNPLVPKVPTPKAGIEVLKVLLHSKRVK